MDAVHDDCYEVFLRRDASHSGPRPDAVEQPLAFCSTYEEARSIRQLYQGRNAKCVIRFVGTSGGGD